MATPEQPHGLEERVTRVEDAVQEFRFIHMVKVEATTNGLATLWAGQKRLQDELSGFRAEATTHLGTADTRLGSIETDLQAVKTEQARQGEKLETIESAVAEILRRLPEQI